MCSSIQYWRVVFQILEDDQAGCTASQNRAQDIILRNKVSLDSEDDIYEY